MRDGICLPRGRPTADGIPAPAPEVTQARTSARCGGARGASWLLLVSKGRCEADGVRPLGGGLHPYARPGTGHGSALTVVADVSDLPPYGDARAHPTASHPLRPSHVCGT